MRDRVCPQMMDGSAEREEVKSGHILIPLV